MEPKGLPAIALSSSESPLSIDQTSAPNIFDDRCLKSQRIMPNVNPHHSPSGPLMIPSRTVILPASLHLKGGSLSGDARPSPNAGSSKAKVAKTRKLSQVFSELPKILASPVLVPGKEDGIENHNVSDSNPHARQNNSSQRNRLVRNSSRRRSLLSSAPQQLTQSGLHPLKALTSPRPSLSATDIPARKSVVSPRSHLPIMETNEVDDHLAEERYNHPTTEQLQRARLAKLTRHLGEYIPPELVLPPMCNTKKPMPLVAVSRDGVLPHHQRRGSLDLTTLLSTESAASPHRHLGGLKRSKSLYANESTLGNGNGAESKEIPSGPAEFRFHEPKSLLVTRQSGAPDGPRSKTNQPAYEVPLVEPNKADGRDRDGDQIASALSSAKSRYPSQSQPSIITVHSKRHSMDALSDTRDSFRGDALGSVSIPQSHVPTSTPSPLPSTSVSSPRPSISVPSPRPSTSVPSPRPSTSAPSPRPSTSISSPRPSTSVSSSRPSMSNNHPQSSSNSTSTASHSRRHQPSGSLPRRPATADSTQESMRAQQRRAVKLANFFGVECEDISTATCLEVGSPLNAERATNTLAQVATVPLTQARVDVDVQVAKPTRFWKFMDGKNTLKNVHADDVMKELRTMKASM